MGSPRRSACWPGTSHHRRRGGKRKSCWNISPIPFVTTSTRPRNVAAPTASSGPLRPGRAAAVGGRSGLPFARTGGGGAAQPRGARGLWLRRRAAGAARGRAGQVAATSTAGKWSNEAIVFLPASWSASIWPAWPSPDPAGASSCNRLSTRPSSPSVQADRRAGAAGAAGADGKAATRWTSTPSSAPSTPAAVCCCSAIRTTRWAACSPAAELAGLAELCLRHDLVICSDEIHQDFIYTGHAAPAHRRAGARGERAHHHAHRAEQDLQRGGLPLRPGGGPQTPRCGRVWSRPPAA